LFLVFLRKEVITLSLSLSLSLCILIILSLWRSEIQIGDFILTGALLSSFFLFSLFIYIIFWFLTELMILLIIGKLKVYLVLILPVFFFFTCHRWKWPLFNYLNSDFSFFMIPCKFEFCMKLNSGKFWFAFFQLITGLCIFYRACADLIGKSSAEEKFWSWKWEGVFDHFANFDMLFNDKNAITPLVWWNVKRFW